MKIKINTKFDIGQEVFVCKQTTKFKEGNFINVYTPIVEPYKVTGITIVCKDKDQFNVCYSIGTIQAFFSESRVFSSLEEATKWCNSYE